jgi:hypothetical protein
MPERIDLVPGWNQVIAARDGRGGMASAKIRFASVLDALGFVQPQE